MKSKTATGSRTVRLTILAVAVAYAAVAAPVTIAASLRAGAAKIDITPPASIFPTKAQGERDFVGVHDAVFARALVLDDGATRTVLVGLEVAIVPNGDQVVKAVAEAAKVAPGNVLVFATHTHSNPLVFYHGHDGTPAQMQEIAQVQEGAVAATRDALSHLQPARVTSGRGEARVNVVNNSNGQDGNKTVAVVRVENTSGQPIAVLVNYSTHGEVMFRSATKGDGYEVSGDLPGAVSRLLEDTASVPVVLYSPGAEADQYPMFKSRQLAVGKLPAVDEGAGGWALLDVQARVVAASVMNTLAALPTAPAETQIAAHSMQVTCPGQTLLTDHDNGAATKSKGAPVNIPLTLVRINDLTLAGVGGDVMDEIGTAIKAAFPQRDTMIVSMTAGSIGYIPSDSAYTRNSREVKGSSLAAGCAQSAIVTGLSELARGH